MEVHIAVGRAVESALQAAASAIPSPIPAVAMIDTGASGTVLRQGLPALWGLNPVGLTFINTPSSTNVACYEYLVRLIFPNNVLWEGTVVEAALQGQNIQCLIGRDVSSHAVLVYIGYTNQFSLSF